MELSVSIFVVYQRGCLMKPGVTFVCARAGCGHAITWALANEQKSGSYCSLYCMGLDRVRLTEGDEGPQMQLFAEDCIDPRAWRHQQGECDVPDQLQAGQNDFGPPGGQIDDLRTLPLFD